MSSWSGEFALHSQRSQCGHHCVDAGPMWLWYLIQKRFLEDLLKMHQNRHTLTHLYKINSLTNIVFPFPGGPNKSRPRAGALKPVKSCRERKTLSNNYC